MSVQSQINRISSNVQTTLQTIADTGVAVASEANSDDLPAAAAALANEKQNKYVGTEYAGQLLYVGNDGALTVLKLGEGLEIVDGVLNITASIANTSAVLGKAILGQMILGKE